MSDVSSYHYKTVAIAGTFDRLHEGHKTFISHAFRIGCKVIIGLTSDRYVQEKLKAQMSNVKMKVNNFKQRKKELDKFLKEEKFFDRAEIIEIHDVYGPSREESDIEALLVTKDSRIGGEEVNRKRKERGLSPLELIEVPLVEADDNRPIASTRIRLGEIDRFGHLYRNLCIFEKGISKKMRLELKKPQGRLIKEQIETEVKAFIESHDVPMIITVGDEVTKLINQIGMKAHIFIFDFHVHRILTYASVQELGFSNLSSYTHEKVENRPGSISKNLVNTIESALKRYIIDDQKTLIEIEGEDDLGGVPAILLAPLGSVILYGQPGEGVVIVDVTEERKKNLLTILKHYNE